MALLRHFDYTPDEADANVRFELRNQEPTDDGDARIALTVVNLESDADDGENLTVQLSPPDLEGLIEALEQAFDEVAPSEDGEEVEAEEEPDEPEPEPERPARRTRASKKQQEEDGE